MKPHYLIQLNIGNAIKERGRKRKNFESRKNRLASTFLLFSMDGRMTNDHLGRGGYEFDDKR
jgi:hypothetical protein